MKTHTRRMGARVALATAVASAALAGFAGSAAAAPAAPAASGTAHTAPYTAADDWYYWHCERYHETWRRECAPPPPPSGSFGIFLNVGV